MGGGRRRKTAGIQREAYIVGRAQQADGKGDQQAQGRGLDPARRHGIAQLAQVIEELGDEAQDQRQGQTNMEGRLAAAPAQGAQALLQGGDDVAGAGCIGHGAGRRDQGQQPQPDDQRLAPGKEQTIGQHQEGQEQQGDRQLAQQQPQRQAQREEQERRAQGGGRQQQRIAQEEQPEAEGRERQELEAGRQAVQQAPAGLIEREHQTQAAS